MESLIKQFENVGLKLEPWVRGDEIFAMDIDGDAFLMQVGEGNDVFVQSIDTHMKQLVLMVHEKPREFEVTIPRGHIEPSDRVIRKAHANRVVVARKTPDEKRHMLLGVDERNHPFVTRLPEAAVTVADAHEALKPDRLKGIQVGGKGKNYKRGRNDLKVVRQGEWFFIETSWEQRQFLQSQENGQKLAIQKKVPIGHQHGRVSGNPHIADELVSGINTTWVRGKVRHTEHKTLKFKQWVEVVRNTEIGGNPGVSWVD